MKRAIILCTLLVLAAHANAQTAPLVVTTTSCPTLTLGVFYQCQFNATGGTPPYHWTVKWQEGYLPGLTMSDSGLLSGTVVQCSNNQPTNCLQAPPSGTKVVIDGVTIPLKAQPIPKQPVEKKKKKKTTT